MGDYLTIATGFGIFRKMFWCFDPYICFHNNSCGGPCMFKNVFILVSPSLNMLTSISNVETCRICFARNHCVTFNCHHTFQREFKDYFASMIIM